MRNIGTIQSPEEARRFEDHLLVEGISCSMEREPDGTFSVWIEDDDQLGEAESLLRSFELEPRAARYIAATQKAGEIRKALQTKAQEDTKSEPAVSRSGPPSQPAYTETPVVLLFIALCVAIFIYSDGGQSDKVCSQLTINSYQTVGMDRILFDNVFFIRVREGQVWRLFTPVLLHFGFLHILFNMLWLHQLGSAIEKLQGSWFLTGMILLMAIFTNVCQYLATGPNPLFGGMSGVIFGLMGYIWMKSKLDPFSGFYIQPNTVFIMIAWMVLCMTGGLGFRTANISHVSGLLIGMAWGYASGVTWARR